MKLVVLLRLVNLPLGNSVLSSYQALERDNRGNRRASLVTLAFLWGKNVFFYLAKAYAWQDGSQYMAFFGSGLIFLRYWAVAFPCCASEQPRPYLATAAATVHHSYSQRQLRKSSIQSFTSTSVCQYLLNNQLLL
jgi:hypothetical protein